MESAQKDLTKKAPEPTEDQGKDNAGTSSEFKTWEELGCTPGPWEWGDGYSDPTEKYADCRLVGHSGQVDVIPIRGDHYQPIWDTWWPDQDEEDEGIIEPREPDRKAIAALPDLYEALRELYFGRYGFASGEPGHPLWKRAYAALRKAQEGQ